MYFPRLNVATILNHTLWRVFKLKNTQQLNYFIRKTSSQVKRVQWTTLLKITPILPSITFLNTEPSDLGVDDSDIEENIAHLIILAKLALEKGDLERARAILDMGLKLSEDRKLVIGTALIYDILVALAINEGDIISAEKLLVTVIERLVQDGSPEDNNQIIDFKLRLARIYSNQKRDPSLAEIGFKTCLDAQTRKLLNGDVSTRTGLLYINVLFWYGIHNIRNDRYALAKVNLDKAYEYSRKIKGLTPYQEMVILYTLADLNIELDELDAALYNMQTAVLLGKGISSSDLPKCYLKLARIYYQMKVYDQACYAAMEAQKLADIFNRIDDLNEANMMLAAIEQARP